MQKQIILHYRRYEGLYKLALTLAFCFVMINCTFAWISYGMREFENKARNEGAIARQHGIPSTANPYRNTNGRAWLEGYMRTSEDKDQ